MTDLSSLTSAQLIKAAAIKDKIEALTKELATLLGSPAPAKSTAKPAKKRGMSAAGKAKIAAAQKLRWQKVNAAKTSKPAAASKVVVKPVAKKRTMSAATKSKIAAAAKARWAKVKATGKKTL